MPPKIHLWICTHGTVYMITLTPIDRSGEVYFISIQAGGNSVHKYSIMFTNAQIINIPPIFGSDGTTEKQWYYEKLSWPSQQPFESPVSTLMNLCLSLKSAVRFWTSLRLNREIRQSQSDVFGYFDHLFLKSHHFRGWDRYNLRCKPSKNPTY